jgi:hypothetical protein
MRFQPGFRFGASTAVLGALYLLTGETDGYAIDATSYDSVTAAAYVGGPVGGTVATIDTGTPANDLSNVPLDASNLVNSGTSPKMVHNASSPYVRWSAHNYAIRSQEFDNASWVSSGTTETANSTTAPDGTSTADTITASAGSSNHAVSYDNDPGNDVYFTGGTYTDSVYLKEGTHRYAALEPNDGLAHGVGILIDLQAGTILSTAIALSTGLTYVSSSIASAGSGWYRVSITYLRNAPNDANRHKITIQLRPDGSDTSWDVSWSAAGTETMYVWGAQSNRGPIATPYLATTSAARIGTPLSYDAAAAQYGILVEPAATNIQLHSENIDSGVGSWTDNNATSTRGATAPDGTATATTVTASAGSGAPQIFYSGGVSGTDAVWTSSVYLKAGTAQFAQIAQVDGTDTWIAATFDLTNGTVTQVANGAGAAGAPTGEIVDVGNGWYRCALTGDNNDATKGCNVHIVDSGAPTQGAFGNVTFTAAGTETVLCWGYQAELGSVATSYIPTLGSTVTRAAEKITALLTTIPIGSEYTLYANALSKGSGGGGQYMWSVDKQDGLDNAAAINYNSPGAGAMGLTVRSGGATAANINGGAVSEAAQFKAAARVKLNDFGVSVNGAAVVTDVSGAIPVSPTHVSFWGSENPGGATGFHFQNAIYPRAFTDPQLVTRAT